MIKNYLKTSIRNLVRYRTYSIINVFGLTIGLATSLFIFLWVTDELSYDQFHSNAKHIYKVLVNNSYPDGRIETFGATPARLKDAIQTEIPEATRATQLSMDAELLLRVDNQSLYENGVYGDESLFSIFSFPIVKGSSDHPLPEIKSISISETLAKKLFNGSDPIGQTVQVGQSHELTVNSVFEDIPKNSTLQFDFVIPFDLYIKENPWTQNWRSGGTRTFVALNPGSTVESINEKLGGLIKKNCEDCSTRPFLFQYTKSRLYNEFKNGEISGGKIQQVVLFSVIAIIILVMACINFTNLATARATTRSNEVGVRKSLGAQKSGLIFQFIIESILISAIALLFALMMVQVLLPFFNLITGKSIQLDFTNVLFTSGVLSITLICGLLAGVYPAFVLSSINVVSILKGNGQSLLSGGFLRKSLVVTQFATAIILVIGSIVVYQQIIFISNRNLGFNKENIIVIEQNDDIVKNYSVIKNDLLQVPAIKTIGFGGSNVFRVPITTTDLIWPGRPENSSISFKVYRCDEDFIPALGITMLAGRNFSNFNNQDVSNYIVNKKAMEAMGLTLESVIGSEVEMWNVKGKIIGVTDDFHNDNLRAAIEPLIFLYSTNNGSYYFVKIDGQQNLNETLAQVEKTFKKYAPDYPFQFTFLDKVFDSEYQNEAMVGRLSLSFTIVAILISCLGLLGLASFTVERRIKELGIRKVMGASVKDLTLMLCGDYAKLIVFSLFIGCPLAFYFASNYLSGFAFHANLTGTVFIVTAMGVFVITFLIVGYQAMKAAISNPVNSLRSE